MDSAKIVRNGKFPTTGLATLLRIAHSEEPDKWNDVTQIDSSCHARTCSLYGCRGAPGRQPGRVARSGATCVEWRATPFKNDWPTLVRYLERKLQELDVEEAP